MRRMSMRAILWPMGLVAATWLVYGSSLGYPFFWVDPIDIGLAGARSIPAILTDSHGYLYYRPFAFIAWKLLHALSGRFDPFVFHFAQVSMHALNAVFCYALARRLLPSTSRVQAGLAALCFVWYPASYQTVTWVISPQVQAMTFMLGSAIAYLDGRLTNDTRKIIVSIALLGIALPFHENAVSFGLVIAALEVHQAMTRRADIGVSRWPLFHIGLCLAFALLWLAIPKDPDSTVARFEPTVGWYLLQGLIWPVAGAVGPWRAWVGGPAWQPLILVAPIVILFLIVVYGYAQRLATLLLGMAWFGVMILPIWATRNFAYVSISPRIFYTSAPGAVLIWVGLLSVRLKSPATNRAWTIGSIALMASVILQSAAFLSVRKELQDKAMPAVWDVVTTGEQVGSGGHALYVNVPDQITPWRREYPVGFFRAILMPVSVDLGQYVQLQTGAQPTTGSVTVQALAGLELFPHQVDMRGEAVDQSRLSAAIREAQSVMFTEYVPDGRVRVVVAGHVERRSTEPAFSALFDGRLSLEHSAVTLDGGRLRVSLTWHCTGTFDSQETIFMHAVDSGGRLTSQADGDPLRDLFPLAQCRPEESITDVRYLAVPPGTYTILTGVYNRATGDRLKAHNGLGQPLPDNAYIVDESIQVTP